MLAYYYAEGSEPYYMPHMGGKVTNEEISLLGIECKKIEMHDDVINEMINEHIEVYPAHDVINLSKNTPRDKLDMFFEEHLHEDAEVRFITKGCGYFDVRSKEDKWIRIKVESGDFIILPAGIYHRFTIDESMTIQALRLFEVVPKWTPINRKPSIETMEARQNYLKSIQFAQ
eukprot:NODE_653_length_5514_cov_0.694552.p4 type:complete len:173 gc:universal NODE_653_length_5514_cov_0.694552:3318-3836(+)